MATTRVNLFTKEEYSYPHSFGFLPNLHCYLHEDLTKRPAILVIPGGGYGVVAEVEGEIVAQKFFDMGYQTFVLTYTTNLLHMMPLGKQPLKEAARAVRMLRKYAQQWNLSNQVMVCGFSAGGHLAASLCVHYQDPELQEPEWEAFSCRPDAAILCYPVITSGEYTHAQSMDALLGRNASAEDWMYMSLEKQVTKETPPCFLWQTAEDEIVPVENSFLMAHALQTAGVLYAYHLFPKGPHGMSTADEAWASGKYGEPYTMEQSMCIKRALETGEFMLPEPIQKALANKRNTILENNPPERIVYPDAAAWVQMADVWLKTYILSL